MAAQAKEQKQVVVGKTTLTVEPGKQEFTVTHMFDAPRERLFRAMTDPTLIPKWWGPRYLTTNVERLEAKPGGSWRFVQTAPDGGVHAFHGVFHDVVSPERVVLTFEYEGAPGHVAMQTSILEDIDGKTLMREQTVFQSVEDRDAMVQSGMEQGQKESIERLTELVASL